MNPHSTINDYFDGIPTIYGHYWQVCKCGWKNPRSTVYYNCPKCDAELMDRGPAFELVLLVAKTGKILRQEGHGPWHLVDDETEDNKEKKKWWKLW